MAQRDPNLLLEINHFPLVLSLLVHEGLLLLLQSLLHALLVLDDPVQGVALLPHVLLALLPGVEEPLHPEYYLYRGPAAAQLDPRSGQASISHHSSALLESPEKCSVSQM